MYQAYGRRTSIRYGQEANRRWNFPIFADASIWGPLNAGDLSTIILTDNAFPLTAARGLGTLPLASVGAATGVLGLSSGGSSLQNSGVTTSWSGGGNQLSEGRISLKIETEVSELTNEGASIHRSANSRLAGART
jgi:Flp pilus assembly secretin CpaC